MKPPLVSVVIPTHNYARFIPEAIESAFAQDYAPLEIIVVDNGSTDETRSVIEPFRERGITYVYQEDAGPGGGRNTGIELARGELVAFLDADDAWLPQKTSPRLRTSMPTQSWDSLGPAPSNATPRMSRLEFGKRRRSRRRWRSSSSSCETSS